jgi:hypothetical protein
MHTGLLHLHSFLRWVGLLLMVITIVDSAYWTCIIFRESVGVQCHRIGQHYERSGEPLLYGGALLGDGHCYCASDNRSFEIKEAK